MRKIIDSCSIILLAKASVLEIAINNYEIEITKEVYKEIIKGKEKMFQESLLIKRLEIENKINLIKCNQKIKNKIIKDFNMGEGEASIIAFGIENKCIIITDNLQGRKAAKINNLPLTGSIGIIVSLFKKNNIDKEKALSSLNILKEEGWFGSYLIEKAVEDIENGRS